MTGRGKRSATPETTGRVTRSGRTGKAPVEKKERVELPRGRSVARVVVKEEPNEEAADHDEPQLLVEVRRENGVSTTLYSEEEFQRRLKEGIELYKKEEEEKMKAAEKAAEEKKKKEMEEHLEMKKELKKKMEELKVAKEMVLQYQENVAAQEQATKDENDRIALEMHGEDSKIKECNDEIAKQQKMIADYVANKVKLGAEKEASDGRLNSAKADCTRAEHELHEKQQDVLTSKHHVENHPAQEAMRYSRACQLCLVQNPSVRAVFVECGHLICNDCVDKLEPTPENTVACPTCRRITAAQRLYEDLE